MAREKSEGFSFHFPFPAFVIRSREEALSELAQPCGRFLPPHSGKRTMRISLFKKSQPVDEFGGKSFVVESGIPLNWQTLVEYLRAQGVTSSPGFITSKFSNDRPRIFNFKLKLDTTHRQTDGHTNVTSGHGASVSAEEAMSKAVGETLERYFLSIYTRASLLSATVDELTKRRARFLDPRSLNGFLSSQKEKFPNMSWDGGTRFHWVVGEQYPGKKALIPAQLVYWNYSLKGNSPAEQEKTIARVTTSGCAGHFSKDEAILAGLLENIQRDGFLIYWLNKLSPRVLDIPDEYDSELSALLLYLKRYRLRVTFLNTTTDIGIPSVVCVLRDDMREGPVISVGGSAGFDIKSMLVQSAIEALRVGNFTATSDAYVLPKDYRPFSDKNIGREERLRIWKGAEMAERFSFFTSGEKQSIAEFTKQVPDIQTQKEQLDYVLQRLKEMGDGYEPYIYEVQDAVLTQLGFHVVRTIVPQLFPLYLHEHAAPLDSKRLREVPAKLGYEAAAEYNPWPHPFP